MGKFGNFNASYDGLGELLVSPQMQAAMREKAEKIKDAAVAASPVGEPPDDKHPGAYKEAWAVESGVREEPTRRAYGRVKNDMPYAAAIEYGNGRRAGRRSQNVPHYTLTRALDAARE